MDIRFVFIPGNDRGMPIKFQVNGFVWNNTVYRYICAPEMEYRKSDKLLHTSEHQKFDRMDDLQGLHTDVATNEFDRFFG